MPYEIKLFVKPALKANRSLKVSEACRQMSAQKAESIVIVDFEDKPIGIFTEQDSVRRVIAQGKDPSQTTLEEVMSPNPTTVEASRPINEVFETLATKPFRHIPVTDGGVLLGMVTLTDLARLLKEVYQEDRFLRYYLKESSSL